MEGLKSACVGLTSELWSRLQLETDYVLGGEIDDVFPHKGIFCKGKKVLSTR